MSTPSPVTTTSPAGVTDYALLVFLALIFGSSFMFTNISVSQIPPLTVAASRLALACIVVVPVMLFKRQSLSFSLQTWFWIALAALLGNAIPFSLISWGQIRVDAGLTSIFMAIMPLTTILLAHWLTQDEKLNRHRLIGVIFGMVGVAVLFGWQSLSTLGDQTLRQLAIVLATVCYALNSIITKKLTALPRYAIIVAILLCGAIQLVPISLALEQPWTVNPDRSVWVSLIALAIGPTALATLIILVIIDRRGASYLRQINFLVPVFGVLLAALFLNETLPANGYIALVLIFIGLAISRRGN